MANVGVVGLQWGDEGKGKVIDILTQSAQVVVRFQGGANAGHTIVVGDEKIVLHLVPSGILHKDKLCVIGNGVVLDPEVFSQEVDELKRSGYLDNEKRLVVSGLAHVIMPYHKKLDSLRESTARKKIGTTGRGIGPAYEDKVNRTGIRVVDLLDKKLFREKVKANVEYKNFLFRKLFKAEAVKASEIIKSFEGYRHLLKRHAVDTVKLLHECMEKRKSVLFEGAQGTYLDIDHGTYPFVTSSTTTAGNMSSGSGVAPTAIDYIVGISKAYTTRVGEGPFPTELHGPEGERMREVGGEYGATTGRPRRCGWFDAVITRRAVRLNGIKGVALMKLDVLDGFDTIKICTGYKKGSRIVGEPFMNTADYGLCEPVYEEMTGWMTSLREIKVYEDLPEATKRYVARVEELIEAPVIILSTGPDRDETIIRRNPFVH